MLRLVHTSDWHLGHTLHEVSREREHRQFLGWLLALLEAEAADALLIAGDLFDTANPSAEAQRQWYELIAEARRRMPRLQVVAIAGNHDSPSRLDAPEALFRALGVRVVGVLPRAERGIDAERVLAPLEDRTGALAAWVAAVPFLRPADLRPSDGEGDPLIRGVREVYEEVLAAARARRHEGQALIAMGHLYMSGTELSELSERKILGGNLHALPHDLFSPDWAYVALGHLHKPQAVGRETVRYCGSPIPLSLDEAAYPHQVCVVDLADGAATVRPVKVPRTVEILRLPQKPAPLGEVLAALALLPEAGETERERLPLLEVRVRLTRPEPALRAKIEEALAGKEARLVKITRVLEGDGRALADAAPALDLRALTPEEVFRRRYQQQFPGEPSEALVEAFHELREQVEREER